MENNKDTRNDTGRGRVETFSWCYSDRKPVKVQLYTPGESFG